MERFQKEGPPICIALFVLDTASQQNATGVSYCSMSFNALSGVVCCEHSEMHAYSIVVTYCSMPVNALSGNFDWVVTEKQEQQGDMNEHGHDGNWYNYDMLMDHFKWSPQNANTEFGMRRF
eukprot:4500766-Pyramimonas_sp.AAC.1